MHLNGSEAEDRVALLGDPFSDSAYRGQLVDASASETFSYLRGESKPPRPLRISRSGGHQILDVLWTTAMWPILLHDRVLDLLKSAQLSGWETYPVSVEVRSCNPAIAASAF
jgi:hypothetical protein